MTWLLVVLFAGQFETAFRAGLVALNANNLSVAESQLESAARIEPRDGRVWLALAQTYWKLQKPDPARAAAQKAEEYTSDAAVLGGLAVYYSEAADYAKSADLLRAAIRRSPSTEHYYFELAQLDLKQQNFAGAIEVLDSARKRFSQSAQLELAAGVAYYGLRRFPEAADAFLRTIELDPGVEQPYVFLGRMLDQTEDKLPRITQAFAAFAKRAPEDYMSRFLYGKALGVAAAEAAEPELRKSVALNDGFWESHFELGVLLDRRGQYEEAAREIRRSIDLNPSDPAPHYRLARLYDRLGKPNEARAERELHARLTSAASGMAGIK
jgi:tetratricopeptide (TPR) repeat protein